VGYSDSTRIDGPSPGCGSLKLDAWGRIAACDARAASLFLATPAMLEGRHIKRLIPDLPLKSSTPDFNTAYAAFCGSQPTWTRYRAVDALGCAAIVEVSFARPGAGHPHIALSLRHTGRCGEPDWIPEAALLHGSLPAAAGATVSG
jgi:hypothetical protein